MAGVRLHHPWLSACTLVVELEVAYANGQAKVCPLCGKEHLRKSLHLSLDAGGNVIVSKQVFAQLQKVFLAGMEVMNEVAAPPPLSIGAVEQPKVEVSETNLNGNGHRFYVPPKTKYESRDKMLAPFMPLINRILERRDREATARLAEKRTIFDMGRGN